MNAMCYPVIDGVCIVVAMCYESLNVFALALT